MKITDLVRAEGLARRLENLEKLERMLSGDPLTINLTISNAGAGRVDMVNLTNTYDLSQVEIEGSVAKAILDLVEREKEDTKGDLEKMGVEL